ncbi:MAG: hypothetical protein M3O70_08225 [Actinomycetota bacterium]|nr:hypothetical protein [Actinomycetota bacterium]
MTLHPDFQRMKDEHEAAKRLADVAAKVEAENPAERVPTEHEIAETARRQERRDWWLGRTPKQLAQKERARARFARSQKTGLKVMFVGLVWTLFVSIPLLLLLAALL